MLDLPLVQREHGGNMQDCAGFSKYLVEILEPLKNSPLFTCLKGGQFAPQAQQDCASLISDADNQATLTGGGASTHLAPQL